ncbi:putative hla class iii protein dom3z [Diaporthe ampelina]|uniref:Decapping nuclease n=1 Tax=Diaporthe ampelina TaxID=1214573 RepID=A0A0G2G0C3_9PEZI|nr:putative hla class iii protein dom3z [Diaporthe ampelina]
MDHTFSIQPIGRFAGQSEPVKRPKEFACFSYDDEHQYHYGDRSLRWYYTPQLGADLSQGFETFVKHDDSVAEHLDSLLKTIMHHEHETKKKIDANVVTWRGVLTKVCPPSLFLPSICCAPAFQIPALLEITVLTCRAKDCIFIEENHAYRLRSQAEQAAQPWRGPISQQVMQFWGYKFETLATLPAPWGETSREYIEGREQEVVNNKAQYCSVVRTGLGKTVLCLGGEVDAVWDSKPPKAGDPINWVELKTSAEMRNDRDRDNFERKLLKFWIQSFLLGVPRIIVGFRSRDGILQRVEDMDVASIPDTVARRGRQWDGNICTNFAASFLECESVLLCSGLRTRIDDEGVWRIRRRARDTHIEVYKTEETTGHGRILTEEFINHRIKLALPPAPEDDDGAGPS